MAILDEFGFVGIGTEISGFLVRYVIIQMLCDMGDEDMAKILAICIDHPVQVAGPDLFLIGDVK